jgi:hypothetical protein
MLMRAPQTQDWPFTQKIGRQHPAAAAVGTCLRYSCQAIKWRSDHQQGDNQRQETSFLDHDGSQAGTSSAQQCCHQQANTHARCFTCCLTCCLPVINHLLILWPPVTHTTTCQALSGVTDVILTGMATCAWSACA